MVLFENGEPEEFLLFVQNFKILLKALGTLAASENIQYLFTLLHGGAICQFDTLFDQVGSTTTINLSRGLGM